MASTGDSLRTASANPSTPAATRSSKKEALPSTKDLTIDNITENVIAVNAQCANPRMRYVLERLVSHLHDFARETRLSTDEWMQGIEFLTATGQICTDVRQVSVCVCVCYACLRSPTQRFRENIGIHPPLGYLRALSTRYLT